MDPGASGTGGRRVVAAPARLDSLNVIRTLHRANKSRLAQTPATYVVTKMSRNGSHPDDAAEHVHAAVMTSATR